MRGEERRDRGEIDRSCHTDGIDGVLEATQHLGKELMKMELEDLFHVTEDHVSFAAQLLRNALVRHLRHVVLQEAYVRTRSFIAQGFVASAVTLGKEMDSRR